MGIVDKAKNWAQGLMGKAKESTGEATDNHSLEAEGRADQHEAKAKKIGEVAKDTFKD